jgi:hypothetical protein
MPAVHNRQNITSVSPTLRLRIDVGANSQSQLRSSQSANANRPSPGYAFALARLIRIGILNWILTRHVAANKAVTTRASLMIRGLKSECFEHQAVVLCQIGPRDIGAAGRERQELQAFEKESHRH